MDLENRGDTEPRKPVEPRDIIAHLDDRQIQAWRKFLSSIATTESTEEAVIAPLVGFFNSTATLKQLEWHARDEVRHTELLKNYVKQSFDYEKKKRTLTDRVIYDGVLPWLAKQFSRYPLPFLSALYFFEWFSESFYGRLIEAAQRQKLYVLAGVLTGIEADEVRHRKGLETLFAQLKYRRYRSTFTERLACWTMLTAIRVDLSLSKAAFYNRHVRENLEALELSPEEFAKAVDENIKRTYRKIAEVSP